MRFKERHTWDKTHQEMSVKVLIYPDHLEVDQVELGQLNFSPVIQEAQFWIMYFQQTSNTNVTSPVLYRSMEIATMGSNTQDTLLDIFECVCLSYCHDPEERWAPVQLHTTTADLCD